MECKTSEGAFNIAPLKAFHKRFPEVPVVVASLTDTHPRLLENFIEVLPWKNMLLRYLSL
jgi:hypothetical protein